MANTYLVFPIQWITLEQQAIPPMGDVPREFLVLNLILDSSKRYFHRTRMSVGTEFEWLKGNRVAAYGEVTRLLKRAREE